MKRTFNYLVAFVIATIAMVSCFPEKNDFEETLLHGKWHSGTEYYRFDKGGTGKTWDTVDSNEDDEGGNFTWTLVKADLTIVRITTTTGGGIPHTYTVIELNATTLKLNDGFTTKVYTKVN